MKVREVKIFTGEKFIVPRCIQRIDTKSTHGWQVRYHGTKMFSDHSQNGEGARQALAKATRELFERIAVLPAPVSLQRTPSANKTSKLPAGISGPIVRLRKGATVRTAALSVLLPQFGMSPRIVTVYIGSENTYTPERFDAALKKAMKIRREAEELYEFDATRSRRRAVGEMRAILRQKDSAAPKPAQQPPQPKGPATEVDLFDYFS